MREGCCAGGELCSAPLSPGGVIARTTHSWVCADPHLEMRHLRPAKHDDSQGEEIELKSLPTSVSPGAVTQEVLAYGAGEEAVWTRPPDGAWRNVSWE